jgi:hypothetical protein
MSDFQPGQSVVIIQTFKTLAFNNGKSMRSKLKFQAGRKGTFTKVLDLPKFLTAPARVIYIFILPYGATRYEVHLSLEEVQKFIAAENETLNQPVQQIQPSLPVVQAPQASRVDELVKLADLKERGLLTEEEFANEKSRILNQPGDVQPVFNRTDEIKHDEGTSNSTNDGAGYYYLWMLSIPTKPAMRHVDELDRILGLPMYAEGIKPKHQPEITAQRKQLIDLMSLVALSEKNKAPARLNKLLSRNDAEGMVSQLRQIGFDAEIRPS